MLKIYLVTEYDAIAAHQKSQQIAKLIGYSKYEQICIAVAVLESIRICLTPIGEGEIIFTIDNLTTPPRFLIKIISFKIMNSTKNKKRIRNHHFKIQHPAINYANLLIDQFEIEDIPGQGRVMLLGKFLPQVFLPITEDKIQNIIKIMNTPSSRNLIEGITQQNQELLNLLKELNTKQDQINELNKELLETNKGVIALSNELEEKAKALKESNEIKQNFILNISHEIKTPILSILGMTGLLSHRIDGELTPEQEKQVLFIQKSAEELLEMVTNILDLSKIEAGKYIIQSREFELEEIFIALRGMFKPINKNKNVNLIFQLPKGIPTLYTDERKLSQIIRNFISNALKFTLEGEIKIFAFLSQDKKDLTVNVQDTGIGIAIEQQDLIFEEFTQIDSTIQKNVKGTGLGLPLSKNFAELLGGNVAVQSELDVGSIFSVTIPIVYKEKREISKTHISEVSRLINILVIDDDRSFHYLLQETIGDHNYNIIESYNGFEGIQYAIEKKPNVILLDTVMPVISGYQVLIRLKTNIITKDIPVIILTSNAISEFHYKKLSEKVMKVFSKKDLLNEAGINKLKNIIDTANEGMY